MFATSFAESNAVLSRPPDMTEEECDPLSVWRGVDTNGNPLVVSCWKPTAEELEEIIRTKRVWLIITGQTMPPSLLYGHSPFPQ